MLKALVVPVVALAVLSLQLHTVLAQSETDEARRLRDSARIFDEVMAAEDKAIPRAVLSKAEGIAIFPNTLKAGLVFGGMRGRGVLSARHDGRWSSPAFLSAAGAPAPVGVWLQTLDRHVRKLP